MPLGQSQDNLQADPRGTASRFARACVRVGHNKLLPESLSEEWLLIEWPEGEAEPTKYWLSTLPANFSFRRLVDLAKLRWRIERDYQELKQEVGLGHYEGRGWRGFHHHAMHRSLWLPDLRASGASPLKSSFDRAVPDACPTRRLPTQICPCGLNVTFQTRSRQCKRV
jgi:SRSO17 transposase